MSRVLVTGAASGLGAALTAAFRARGDEVLATDVAFGVVSTGSDGGVVSTGSADDGRSAGSAGGVVSTGSTDDGRSAGSAGPTGGVISTGSAGGGRSTDEGRGGGGGELRLDITSEDDWAAARDWVVEHWGGLDVLVNNAGVAGGGRIEVAGLDEWQRVVDVNLLGAVRGCRALVPVFQQQRSGRIVNIASLAGLVHPAGMAPYNAVKAGVVALTETLGHELASYGVRCHAVCPSYFRTNLLSSVSGADDAVCALMTRLVERAPLGAEEIATAVLAGIDAGEELILPDPAARAAYQLKLRDRAAYDAQLRHQADRLRDLPR